MFEERNCWRLNFCSIKPLQTILLSHTIAVVAVQRSRSFAAPLLDGTPNSLSTCLLNIVE